MCKTDQENSKGDKQSNEDDDSDFQASVKEKKKKKAKINRIHKIPIRIQQQLFIQVFQEEKQIKQVAQDLDINYSSAKSLIHYYKHKKRPAPFQVVDVLNGKKPCTYKQVGDEANTYDNLKIEIRLHKELIKSYSFFAQLKWENQIFPQQCQS